MHGVARIEFAEDIGRFAVVAGGAAHDGNRSHRSQPLDQVDGIAGRFGVQADAALVFIKRIACDDDQVRLLFFGMQGHGAGGALDLFESFRLGADMEVRGMQNLEHEKLLSSPGAESMPRREFVK